RNKMNYTDLNQSKALKEIFDDVETEKYWFLWLDKWLTGEIISYESNGDINLTSRGVKYTKGKGTLTPAHTTDTLLELLPAEIEEKLLTLTKGIGNYAVRYKDGNDGNLLGERLIVNKSLLTAL